MTTRSDINLYPVFTNKKDELVFLQFYNVWNISGLIVIYKKYDDQCRDLIFANTGKITREREIYDSKDDIITVETCRKKNLLIFAFNERETKYGYDYFEIVPSERTSLTIKQVVSSMKLYHINLWETPDFVDILL